MFFAEEYTVQRGILDYIVRFPDGDVLRIAPVQQLLVERAGQRIALAAYDATNEEIIDAAIMIRNDVSEDVNETLAAIKQAAIERAEIKPE